MIKADKDQPLISVDFSQIELRLLAQRIQARQRKWKDIKAHTEWLPLCHLRKSRARTMVEAIVTGEIQEKGNLRIWASEKTENERTLDILIFEYRGSIIAQWAPENNQRWEPFCGQYENTSSTRNQRKMVWEAVEEFNLAVIGC